MQMKLSAKTRRKARMLGLLALATVSSASAQDCDADGVPDAKEILNGSAEDCNGNGIPDACELAGSVLLYRDLDGHPLPAGVEETMNGLWHVEADCRPAGACGAGSFAYFGRSMHCDFDAGNVAGIYSLANIQLPANHAITLSFCSYYDAEAGCGDAWSWDNAQVLVRPNGAGDQLVDNVSCGNTDPMWQERTVDLGAFAGQTVRLTFWFDAVDAVSNETFGWGVDEVRIVVRASNAPSDMNGNSVPDECETSAVECVGDGSVSPCPCGNSSPSEDQAGCLNSTGSGGSLRGIGLVQLSSDTLVLHGAGMPNQPVLYFQGASSHAPVPFGDGLKCTGGPFIRLGIRPNVAGSSSYPSPGDLPVSIRGMVTQPGTLYYQARYRDASPFCTPATFNYTNVVAVTWTP